ncbi:hypothetical protein DRP53_09180 [candidate division WOR-3 bacterium]|uniref:NodB homology domain-containing protein n=1 Tax=candidate division WOR-3 bacterium TaxID=2052148 RepID=A0A660SGI0_UNCW3|nr:MAG: hypothetical protein DRP53_09180 [candidate division WOR-3 bacterium]
MLRILTFHKVARFDLSGTWNTPEQMERFLMTISERRIDVLSLSRLSSDPIRFIADKKLHLLITFDDGDEGIYRYLLPVLKRIELPIAVFLITGYIGRVQSWDRFSRSRQLSWAQIFKLRDLGCEFGSHSVSHRDLTQLNLDELRMELLQSRRSIKDKLGECDAIAYPYDRVNPWVAQVAERIGYRVGFGSKNLPPLSLVRERIFRTDTNSSFQAKIAPRESLLLRWERFKARIINLFSIAAMKR